ncbi:MAG: 23S rRNA (uracil(1939)-C(5))-methyltransferase RlmD [Lachnospiraceae bacterium]|nr:23S rRNA (uracil(1939)-C(5))-methyltransferase RlmD [Lachnospiraceae bacterium]
MRKADCILKKNDEFEIDITDIGNDGEGIGRYDGMAFFIKGAVIGDRILAGATKLKKTYGYARLVKVLEPSPFRVMPACSIAGRCGGCQLQPLSYEKQLEFKENKVRNDLIRLGAVNPERFSYEEKDTSDAGDSVIFHPIIGMSSPANYRNKGQFPVGCDKAGKLVTGFYAGHSHSIIDTDSCMIQHPITDYVMRAVRAYMTECGISAYDEEKAAVYAEKNIKKNDLGLVRHVLTRVGFTTHELMVCVVINGRKLPKWEKLQEKIEEAIESYNRICRTADTKELISGYVENAGLDYRLASLSIDINTENTNVIMGNEVITLAGQPYIEDYIGDVKYRISPLSFYQVNPLQTKVLYSKALEYAALDSDDFVKKNGRKPVVWDLYCGIGTISLFLAQKAEKVFGVEIVPQAIDDARMNAKINGINNAEFFVGAAEEVLPAKYSEAPSMRADVIVVDPPRKGCDEKLLNTLVKMEPERIVYVSCDPATLSRDVKFLEANGYELKEVQPVDQFPYSVHVETVVLMSKVK